MPKANKEIVNVELHEEIVINEKTTALKVAHGYIYKFYEGEAEKARIVSTCFVPFNFAR